MTTTSTSTPAPAYQSPHASPPPQYTYTVVPPTPRNETVATRFIESVPDQSSPSSMTLPMLHAQPPPAISTSIPAEAIASPVRSNSGRSPLSRRVRHGSLRLSSTVQTRPSVKDDHHTRSVSSSKGSSVLSPEHSQRSPQLDQLQLPQIYRISPIMPPSQLSPPSPTVPPTEGIPTSIATQGHDASTAPAAGGHVPDFEPDAPPSPGSIASTPISPSLTIKRVQLEQRVQGAMDGIMHGKLPADSVVAAQQQGSVKSKGSRRSTPNKSLEISLQREDVPGLQKELGSQSRRSKKSNQTPSLSPPPSLSPSHKAPSKRSQRSVSQSVSSTSPPLQQPEQHPNRLFAMQQPDIPRDISNASTPRLSYASLNHNAEPLSMPESAPAAPSTILPQSFQDLPPDTPVSTTHRDRQYHETPVQSILRQPSYSGKTQSQKLTVEVSDIEDRPGSRVAVSSASGEPQRSIPRHDSPEPNSDSNSDHTETPVPMQHHTLRRKKPVNYAQAVQSPSASAHQPLVVYMGDPAVDDSAISYSSQGRTKTDASYTSGISQPAQALIIDQPPSPRTLDSVRTQVAREIALRTMSKSNLVDGVKVGVTDASSAWSGSNDIPFIHLISSFLNSSFALSLTPYLFIITATSFSPSPTRPTNGSTATSGSDGLLYITSSSREIASRAVHLTSAKFIGRITSSTYTFSTPDIEAEKSGNVSLGFATKELEWMARIKELHFSSFDSDIIHSILLNASRTPLDPTVPPPGSKSINTILEEARAQLARVTPRQALTELRAVGKFATGGNNSGRARGIDVPTVLVDIRPQAQRDEFGVIPGALIIERNVLEWRFDPRSEARLPVADRYDLRVIVHCQEGYTSSLAAHSLQQLGLLNATDIIGGFKAWKDAGLPVEVKVMKERSIASAAGSMV